ncbi:T9SS type A sorting domain-containing protein [Nonlabens sp. Asnod2-A12]|uniref:T9SS type A sorting domain-containing protein n=1 Tax=Nonlabens sp. Asnod2-A12 TaxID=3160578 RepID=UPI003867766F
MKKLLLLLFLVSSSFSFSQCDFNINLTNSPYILVYVNDVNYPLGSNFQNTYTLTNINDGDIIKIIKPHTVIYAVQMPSTSIQITNSSGIEVYGSRTKNNNNLDEYSVKTVVYVANCDVCETIQNVVTTDTGNGFTSNFTSNNNSFNSNYELIYGGRGFDPSIDGTIVANSITTFNVSVPDGYYDYYLRANCSNGSTDWFGPFEIKTGVDISMNNAWSRSSAGHVFYGNYDLSDESEFLNADKIRLWYYEIIRGRSAAQVQTMIADIIRIKGLKTVHIRDWDNFDFNLLPDDVESITISNCNNLVIDFSRFKKLTYINMGSVNFAQPPTFDQSSQHLNSLRINDSGNNFDLNELPPKSLYSLIVGSNNQSGSNETQFSNSDFNISRLTEIRYLSIYNSNIDNITGVWPQNLRHLTMEGYFSNAVNISSGSSLEQLELSSPNLSSVSINNIDMDRILIRGGQMLNTLNVTNVNTLNSIFYNNTYDSSLSLNRKDLTGVFSVQPVYNVQNVNLDIIGGNLSNTILNVTNSNFKQVGLNSIKYGASGNTIAQGTNISTLNFNNNLISTILMINGYRNLNFENNTIDESIALFPNTIEFKNIRTVLNLQDNKSNYTPINSSDRSLKNVNIDFEGNLNLDLSNAFKWETVPNLTVEYTIEGNNFTNLNLKGQQNLNENLINITSNSLVTSDLRSLKYICVPNNFSNQTRQNIDQNFLTRWNRNLVFNDYCNFTPGPVYNNLSGSAILDSNNNGCDINDINFTNLSFSMDNSIYQNQLFSRNNSGLYATAVVDGNYTITPNPENPSYWNFSPSSVVVDFPNQTSPFTQDFCVTANGVNEDLEVIVVPLEQARPGFDTDYKVVVKNKGNVTTSGTVTLDFEEDFINLLSSTPTAATPATNQLSWSVSNLQPFQMEEYEFTMTLNTPTQTTNPLNGNDILTFTGVVTGTGTDAMPADNTMVFDQTVVNSYDPNDKTCLEGKTIDPSDVGEYVHYMIRFENTGTASAVNIVVKDEIDLSQFDISTLIPLGGSHDYYTRVRDNNVVEFIHEDINLDFNDATNDGYVLFKIKTLSTLVAGDTFDNTADIFFDFNAPIVTNTETVSIMSTASVGGVTDSSISIYPNPANSFIHATANNAIESISVTDINGRMITATQYTGAANEQRLEIGELSSGIYFVTIKSNAGQKIEKLVVE